MKAVVLREFGGPEVLESVERPRPDAADPAGSSSSCARRR